MRLDDYCRAVGRDCRLNMTDRAVMWTMQTYVNRRTGETFVSLPTIAADICAGVSTVRRSMRRLEDFGVIAAVPRIGRTTVYRFPLHPALTGTPPTSGRGEVSTTPPTTDRGGSPQPRPFQPHTPPNTDGNPAHQWAGNHVSNHVKEPRDVTPADDVAVAVPASVAELLRPFAAMGGRT